MRKPEFVDIGEIKDISKTIPVKPLTAISGTIPAKPSTAISTTRVGKQSRGSLGTTNATWSLTKSRAQTALENGKRITKSRHHKGETELTVKEKMEADHYYQPSNQEAKDLVAKYFP